MQKADILDPQAHFLDEPDLPRGITRFWLIRHGVVDETARQTMYGTLDVPLCPHKLIEQRNAYASLAQRLPRQAIWRSSPLSRAYQTGLEIQKAGKFSSPIIKDPEFIEQSIGDWNGVPHNIFPSLIQKAPHPFWSIAADERPPHGESMEDVQQRVGNALINLAHNNAQHDTIILSHGGAIRMALAYALNIDAHTALNFTIQNLSMSIIEYIHGQWRVIAINALPDFHGKA